MKHPRFGRLAAADWLTADRARVYAGILAAVQGLFLAVLAVLFIRHTGKPVAVDFDAFWAASHLAAGGHAASAYDNTVIEATERAATEMAPGYLAFYYPPPYLLLILPLGLLGYVPALVVFLAGESLLLLAALRRLLPQRWAWLPLLTWPGLLMNGLSGQNAALSTACFAAAAIWLEKRPVVAGMCLGGLVCKPQLAVCVPVALLAARRWRALIACGLTAACLLALSWLVLGPATWHGFLANAPKARADIETIAIKWPKMQSVFGEIRLAGGGNALAYAMQAVMSAACMGGLAWVAWRRPGARLEASALAAAALLFTPFLYDYDLLLLAVPMACMAALGVGTGWRPWEKCLLAALYILPLFARAFGLLAGVIIGPPLVAAMLLLVVLRTRPASGVTAG
jgi:hypothetical protein